MNEPSNIYPLLKYEFYGDTINKTGPMGPIISAGEVAKSFDLDLQHLARVSFNDPEMLQEKDGDGITAYDHLVIVRVWKNTTLFAMYIDMGVNLMPTVYMFSKDKELMPTELYTNYNKFIKIPTNDQYISMFMHMYDNPDTFKHPSYYEVVKQAKEAINGKEKV